MQYNMCTRNKDGCWKKGIELVFRASLRKIFHKTWLLLARFDKVSLGFFMISGETDHDSKLFLDSIFIRPSLSFGIDHLIYKSS